MKSLLFIGQFPPPKHGVSVINEFLSKELGEYYSVTKYDYRFSKGLKEIGRDSIFSKLLVFWFHFFLIFKLLVLNRYDLIYFTPNVRGGVFFRDLLVVILLKLSRADVYLHLHGLGIKDNSTKKFWRFMYGVMFRGVNVIHVSERVLVSEFFSDHFGASSLSFLNNSIDLDFAAGFFSSAKGEVGEKVIVHMSNFRPSKGVMDVLKIYENIRVDFPCKLRLVGSFTSDKFEREVKEYIEEKDLGGVEILGFLDSEDKFSALADSDLFVYPSYDDSFGLVMLEAQAVGLPVVCYDVGSMRQIVNPKSGHVCEVGDIRELEKVSRSAIKTEKEQPDLAFLSDYDLRTYTNRLYEIMERSHER